MEKAEQRKLLKESVAKWNAWRDSMEAVADLSGIDLSDTDLSEINLSSVLLRHANLNSAKLCSANLEGTNLEGATLMNTNLRGASLSDAYARGANLSGANLSSTNLINTNFLDVNLRGANLAYANLCLTKLDGAILPKFQILQNVDLFGWKRLEAGMCKLYIPEKAKRTACLVSGGCRAEYAGVIWIEGGRECSFNCEYPKKLLYTLGEYVFPDGYDDDVRTNHTSGIHFYLTPEGGRR